MDGAALKSEIDALYRRESRRVLATLVRLLGDFDSAEEALHEAFSAALRQWPQEGMPDNPRAWLVSVGRFRLIDQRRRLARFENTLDERAEELLDVEPAEDGGCFEDDQLRLIFTCCHPALSPEAQIALTLREVCGLTTEAIASAFLVSAPTVAQRIVRAKAKIRDARIPYEVPSPAQLPERLDTVLRTIYLVFNEGYSASEGEQMQRGELVEEAIRLTRLLVELLAPLGQDGEARGLLALMLLHQARSATRMTAEGDLIRLEDQDRRLWDRERIREGAELVLQALRQRRIGSYVLQAAIAAVHAESPSFEHTDWQEICGLYEVLLRLDASPVVELNLAVAVAMRDGAEAGLRRVEALLAQGELEGYYLAHAARADLCQRLGRTVEAREAYRKALALTRQLPEQRYLAERLAALD